VTGSDGAEQQQIRSDHLIARLAGRQHGRVARWQLVEAGLTDEHIRSRVARGSLHRRARAVFAVGHGCSTPRARLMEAVLGAGPGAVADGQGAAWLWGCDGPLRLDVAVPHPRQVLGARTLRGLASDAVVLDGIPCLDWPRVLRELRCGDERLRHVVERLVQEGHFDLRRVDTTRRPQLRRVLARVADEPDRVRSAAEARLRAALRRAGLEPRSDVVVAGKLRDLAWPAHRYALELDSPFHDGPWSRRADAAADRAARDEGWVVDRVDVEDPTEEVVALVARRLNDEGPARERALRVRQAGWTTCPPGERP
jgi:hypothetical protein